MLWWSQFPELYLSGWDPSVPPWFPLLLSPAVPLYPGPPHRPVNTAVEADDDRQGKETEENQPAVGERIIIFTRRGPRIGQAKDSL